MAEYFNPVKVIFGERSFSRLFEEIESSGVKNPLVICGGHFTKSIKFSLLHERLGIFSLFTNVEANPATASVNAAAKVLNDSNCDAVIGIGGGSVLDVAKVVACMKNSKKKAESFYKKIVIKERVPFFALPTTAGSGSEVTKYSVLTVKNGMKKSLHHDSFYAKTAIVDPELTYSCQPDITASSGLDALCQAIESYWARNATPQTDEFAKEAISLAYHSLEKAVKDPDKGARYSMSLASLRAGQAFSNTGTSACHTLSYPFSKYFGLVHGFAVAISLPWFMKYYSESDERTEKRILEVCSILGAKTVDDGRYKIVRLMESCGAPTNLSAIGCKREDFAKIIRSGLEQRKQNPREHTKEDLQKLLSEIY